VEELVKNDNFKAKKYDRALEDTFLKMDDMMKTPTGKKELFEFQRANDDNDDGSTLATFESLAGCTANVVLIIKNTIYVANAGDSRAVLSEGGKAVELSIDHKPDLEAERERISKAGGFITDGRINGNLNLSRAIGDFEYKKASNLSAKEQLVIAFPEVKSFPLTSQSEFILMGCDGIWESLTNEEIIAEVAKLNKSNNNDLQKTVEDLLDKLLAPDTTTGIGCDNMTSILITLK